MIAKVQAYKNCSGRQGGRIFNWSCSIRFQLAPFFNAQAAEAAMSTGLVNASCLNFFVAHSVP
jgi:hypothetical protein